MRNFYIFLVPSMLTAIASFTAVATSLSARHSAGPYWQSARHLHPNDYIFLRNLPQSRSARALPAGFKTLFVDAMGLTSKTKGPVGTKIEVAGSPETSDEGLEAAADVVAKMTMYMPESVFKQLATTGSVGVFTVSEKVTVYPEFASLASGECGESCDGDCSSTCTFDGRKYEDLDGVSNVRAAIVEVNVLCTDADPYGKTENILGHEFSHTVHSEGLTDATKNQIHKAYVNAKSQQLWDVTSYAMSDEYEYFAEASEAFHYVSENNEAAGGMVYCSDDERCPSLKATREHLRTRDPNIYNILKYVFTDNRPLLESGLTVCPSASVVG